MEHPGTWGLPNILWFCVWLKEVSLGQAGPMQPGWNIHNLKHPNWNQKFCMNLIVHEYLALVTGGIQIFQVS